MNLKILNKSFEVVAIVDDYINIIWNERFKSAGDFELHLLANSELANIVKKDFYLYREVTDYVMIIRKIKISTDFEEGNKMILTGYSLEGILKKRVIAKQLEGNAYANLELYIKDILDTNIISPQNTARKISSFGYVDSGSSAIKSMTTDDQAAVGEGVYDKIVSLCNSYNIGFRVRLTDSNTFSFKLYSGVDRSYDQTVRNSIIFSPEYDNLLSSDFYSDADEVKTSAIVAGPKKQDHTITINGTSVTIPIEQVVTSIGDEYSGMTREEVYVDKSDINRYYTITTEEGSVELWYNNDVYATILKDSAKLELDKYKTSEVFSAEIDPFGQWEYQRDFNLGDIVQIKDGYGRETKARVSSYIVSDGSDGYQAYPTFEIKS